MSQLGMFAYNDGMIKIAIVGYGNVGKACERIAVADKDFELIGIFTRRDPDALRSPFNTNFYPQVNVFDFDIDVLIICTGSANDVEDLTPRLAEHFNTVDSFDTHAKMRRYIAAVDDAAKRAGRLSFVGIGWDPGLFSMMRALFNAVLAGAKIQTFWGRGVSQGHSEAIRRISGVLDARQYTVPIPSAVLDAEEGKADGLSDRQKHRRDCYVVAENGADRSRIEREIVTMPNYFAPYDTTVHFVDMATLEAQHFGMPHAGQVIAYSEKENISKLKLSLSTTDNPDLTAGIMMAYAKANAYLYSKNHIGAYTVMDIPLSALYGYDAAISPVDFV